MTSKLSGGHILVQTLINHEVTVAFCVPGESYLAVLESLRQHQDKIQLIINKHESGATFGATAYARLSNKPGVAFVSRGPGATNAAIGVHTAHQDSTPLVLFVGQVPTTEIGREAFQEVNYKEMFKPLCKQVFSLEESNQLGTITHEALTLAVDGRPGPVVVELPEDISFESVANTPIPTPKKRSENIPKLEDTVEAVKLINASRHPLIIAGEMINFEEVNHLLKLFVDKTEAGVCSAFRRQGVISTEDPAYLGQLGLALAPYQEAMWQDIDLVVAIGTRLDAATTMDFQLIKNSQKLIHIFPDSNVLKSKNSNVAINADCATTFHEMIKLLRGGAPKDRIAWRITQRQSYLEWASSNDKSAIGDVDMTEVMKILGDSLPNDCTVTNDAGNFATWIHRYLPYKHPKAQAGPASGSMGFGVPGAIGAQLARPDRLIVCLVGDGGFLMTGQEMITAIEHDLPIKVIVCDNSAYGTIAMHQAKKYGQQCRYAVDIKSPDFALVAKAWGIRSWSVTKTHQFSEILHSAIEHNGPALIHLKTDLRDLAASGMKLNNL